MPDRIALVIPVRSFEHGKTRLADDFTPEQRAHLARAMAEVVVAPRVDTDTIVVANDESIERWARSRAAKVVTTDARGLNPSLTACRDSILQSTDADWIVIAHADLPLASDIVGTVADAIGARPPGDDCVFVATDRRRDGTNVLALSRAIFARWEFAYGPESLRTHSAQAARLGLPVIEIADASLAVDIDTHDDLHVVRDFVSAVLPDWTPR